MSNTELVENVNGLISGALASGQQPPFRVSIPRDKSLNERFVDGQDDLGSLRERLLRIAHVADVTIGEYSGAVSVTSIRGHREPS